MKLTPPSSLFAALTVVALAAPACSRRPPPAADAVPSATASAPPAPPLAASPAPSATAPPAELADAYQGKLDPDLAVMMRLRREGDALHGTYFYERRGVDLPLEGTIAKDGSFSLSETSDGKKTGIFSGRLEPGGDLAGTWSDGRGEKSRSFRLTPIARRPAGPATIGRKRLMSRRKARSREGAPGVCERDLAYPEVFGLGDAKVEARINEALLRARREAGWGDDDCDTPSHSEGDFAVHLNRSGVLSVVLTFYADCDGCAHPAAGGQAVNVLVTTGLPLRLDALLLPGGRAKLSRLLVAPIRGRFKAIGEDATGEIGEEIRDVYLAGDYVFDDKGLRLIAFFQLPHALQAFDGDIGVVVPYDKLAGVLDPKSPAAAVWSAP